MNLRRVTFIGLIAVAALGWCVSAWAELAGEVAAGPVKIRVERLAGFAKADPARRRFGRLEFRGGLVLTSDVNHFGGLSDLVVAADGRQFTAISDGGTWLAGDIVYNGDQPVALENTRIGPLLAKSGRALEKKREHDAEGVALVTGDLVSGTVLVAFERNHRIGRFPVRDGGLLAPTHYLNLPAEARRMKSNKGFEALAVLRGGAYNGAVLAIAERLPGSEGHHTGWLWVKDVPRQLAVRDIGEFDVTGAAALKDGAVILLERRFRWSEGIRMRVRHVKAKELVPGGLIEGEILLEADGAYEIDNMEGLAVHNEADGKVVLTLISDNNFNPLLQRTLLLQFTLAEGRSTAGGR